MITKSLILPLILILLCSFSCSKTDEPLTEITMVESNSNSTTSETQSQLGELEGEWILGTNCNEDYYNERWIFWEGNFAIIEHDSLEVEFIHQYTTNNYFLYFTDTNNSWVSHLKAHPLKEISEQEYFAETLTIERLNHQTLHLKTSNGILEFFRCEEPI